MWTPPPPGLATHALPISSGGGGAANHPDPPPYHVQVYIFFAAQRIFDFQNVQKWVQNGPNWVGKGWPTKKDNKFFPTIGNFWVARAKSPQVVNFGPVA